MEWTRLALIIFRVIGMINAGETIKKIEAKVVRLLLMERFECESSWH